jgi:hypothetical protein
MVIGEVYAFAVARWLVAGLPGCRLPVAGLPSCRVAGLPGWWTATPKVHWQLGNLATWQLGNLATHESNRITISHSSDARSNVLFTILGYLLQRFEEKTPDNVNHLSFAVLDTKHRGV